MGSSSSKKKGGGGSKPATAKVPTTHGPLPQDIVPYTGPIVQHSFVDVKVTFQPNVKLSFFNSHVTQTTTNVDNYYQLLGAQYAEGLILASFVRVPGSTQKQGALLFSMNLDVECPFQGIFTHFPQAPSPERWQLKIEKSLILFQGITTIKVLQTASSQTSANTSHLIDLIASNAANGGRLVCIALTGTTKTEDHKVELTGKSVLEVGANVNQAVGVDLFFNMPLHANPTIYTYMCVVSPIPIQIQAGIGKVDIDINFDFNAQLQMHLSQGYRLAEVCFDGSSSMQSQGMFMPTAGVTINSVWFFEKDASKANDISPVYEGCVVEHYVDISANLRGPVSRSNWAPLMERMGNMGWEFTCSLQTPKMARTGMYGFRQTVLLFFQRKLMCLNTGAPIGFVDPSTQPSPPSYDKTVGN